MFRKICQKFHQLHSVVLPQKMEKDVQHFDSCEKTLQTALTVLQTDKASKLDQDERHVTTNFYPFSFFLLFGTSSHVG